MGDSVIRLNLAVKFNRLVVSQEKPLMNSNDSALEDFKLTSMNDTVIHLVEDPERWCQRLCCASTREESRYFSAF